MNTTTTQMRSIAARLAAVFALVLAIAVLLPGAAQASTRHVVDEVDLLSSSVEQELEAEITRVSARYGQDIVVLYADLDAGKTPMEMADDYFDYNGYGIGADRSGILLLVAPTTRDWWISTRGKSITTFTDAGLDALGRLVTQPLGDDDWEGGARVFVGQMERYMQAAEDGEPITTMPTTLKDIIGHWIGAIGVGLTGGITAARGFVKRHFIDKMTNEGLEPGAASYVADGTFAVSGGQDTFIRTYVTKTPRPTDNDSRGGSSTHTSSSGATHGGAGGKF